MVNSEVYQVTYGAAATNLDGINSTSMVSTSFIVTIVAGDTLRLRSDSEGGIDLFTSNRQYIRLFTSHSSAIVFYFSKKNLVMP